MKNNKVIGLTIWQYVKNCDILIVLNNYTE